MIGSKHIKEGKHRKHFSYCINYRWFTVALNSLLLDESMSSHFGLNREHKAKRHSRCMPQMAVQQLIQASHTTEFLLIKEKRSVTC